MHVTITIEGPGKTFDYHINVIKDALEKAGVKVILNNPEPLLPYNETLMHTVEFGAIMNIVHQPWGG